MTDTVYYKRQVQPGEMAMYRFLNEVAPVYNPKFSALQLPTAIEISPKSSQLFLPFYEGERFDETWQMENGGIPLGVNLSVEVPQVLRDLAQVETRLVLDSPHLQNISKLQFNHAAYLPEFIELCEGFVKSEVITKTEQQTAVSLLQEGLASPLILNNGDFYPPNFIRLLNGKIVLIDWETWNPHSRAFILDHIENVAAYCLVDMWGNEAWQKNFVTELKKLFSIKKEDLQKAILMKAADIAIFWLGGKTPFPVEQSPMILFKQALTPEYMDWLWE